MADHRVLKEATTAPNAVRYQLLALTAGLTLSIFPIPILPIAIPIAAWYWKRYYAHLRVRLTTRELKVDRGVMIREEKSIPLEKITDLAVFQGPIMRRMGLKGIKVETAGQSSGTSALVSIVGIEDVDEFRDRVLSQRDRITDTDDEPRALPASEPSVGGEIDRALLTAVTEIRDTLARIETSLSNRG